MLGLRRHAQGRSGALQYAQNAKAWVRDYCTAIKWGRWHPFTPLERKAREATRNEAWGPTGTLLNELAEASSEIESCQIIFAVLELRLGYPSEKWRNVYKALQVLEFLTKRGSDHCIAFAKDDIHGCLKNLRHFDYIGPDGRDYGVNVRIRADAIDKMLEDEDLLSRDRAQLKAKMKKTYQGFSRTEMEAHEGVGRANSWGGSMRNPSLRELNAPEIVETAVGGTPELKSRGAGEMKGVSLEENRKNLAVLKEIMSRDKNRVCADCVGGSQPTWASINCGVFICMKCAGIHRGLGVHISKVRSCTLDTWLPEQLAFMDKTGNNVANSYWEAKLPKGLKPSCGDPNLEAFIKRKYNKFYAQGSWPPEEQAGTETVGQVSSTSDSRSQPRPAGAFWSRIDNSNVDDTQGFEDNIFCDQDATHSKLHVVPSIRLQNSAFHDHSPSQPVLLPTPSRASTESGLLFHAHTYPDFLSFDSVAFPSTIGDPQQSTPQAACEPRVPQPSTDDKNQPPEFQEKQSSTHTRGKLKSKGNSSVIVTNELDLDDLDDVESMCGFGLINTTDHRPNHSSSVSGFDEHAEWPTDVLHQAQVLPGLPSQARASHSPFSDVADKSVIQNVKQGPTNDYTKLNVPQQSGLSPRIHATPPEANLVTSRSSINRVNEEGKNPIDELSSNFAFDLLSGPMAHAQEPPLVGNGNTLKDPFSDLEPLEPLMVQIFPQQEAPAPPPVMPEESAIFKSDVHWQEVEIHPVLKSSGNRPEYSSRYMGSFIGEGGTHSRKHLPPVRANSKSSFSRQGLSNLGQVASPVISVSPDGGMRSARRSNVDAPTSWNNPHSGVTDIDKILFQQIEKLEINGSHARGVQSGVFPGILRKSSMKETRASMGNGV